MQCNEFSTKKNESRVWSYNDNNNNNGNDPQGLPILPLSPTAFILLVLVCVS